MANNEDPCVPDTSSSLPQTVPASEARPGTALDKLTLKLRNASIGSVGRNRFVGISLAMLLLALVLSWLLVSLASGKGEVLAPVRPGTPIKRCRRIDIGSLDRLSLEWLDDLIESTATNHLTMATAQHFGLNYCAVAVCEDNDAKKCFAMLNPEMTNTHSPATVKHEDTLLCADPVAVQTQRFRQIDVAWYDRRGREQSRHFTKPQSYKLQHMLDVLYGTDVCG